MQIDHCVMSRGWLGRAGRGGGRGAAGRWTTQNGRKVFKVITASLKATLYNRVSAIHPGQRFACVLARVAREQGPF